MRDIWDELNIISAPGKHHLRIILDRMEARNPPLIKHVDKGFGTYRKLDNEAPILDWRSANSQNIVPLKWPFELEKYALMYPKNVAIVAGSKQEGKSTFLYEFTRLNMYDYAIDLYSSETGAEQMKDRFTDLGIPLDAPFNVYER